MVVAQGYYTLALAEFVGPEGRVYAVDSDGKAIRALEKKAVFGAASLLRREMVLTHNSR